MDKINEIKEIVKELSPIVIDKKEKQFNKEINNLERTIESSIQEAVRKIFDDGDSKTMIIFSEGMGMLLKVRDISSSKIRNIFGYVKRIDLEINNNLTNLSPHTVNKLMLLSPKMAYVIGREKGLSQKALKILKNLFDKSIEKIGNSKDKFKTFMDLFESILSYHKFYGGKN